MLNQIALAEQLSPSTVKEAINIYSTNIKNTNYNVNSIKKYLNTLNIFLYTYFLLKYNRDLENLAHKNDKIISNENNLQNLIHFGEKLIKEYSNNLEITLEKNDHLIIKNALDIINVTFNKKITLTEIADKLHISKNYLCCLFKKETGYRFCEYINILRVNRAKLLIIQSRKNFDYIAYDCGFSSQSHFSTTFKKYTGTTPNQFKININNTKKSP
ncbi:AraC-type DNA-binding protein [Anaerosphaera aminiphila DSM 21120]|uniref:AraC-type DNA-binding protein n=1 Tax=Anaerosphaera aminiphila DSM 21120 TaxID=1120995 RepID=A0A1M5NTM3_9FIRM|nr:helix-turn-helix domain-containing protein [Anaerosphaera aminiphila]SHG92916.1 AraC-type DNA-binding protein [Anaerosphaera aminiphila DSM 21120]